MCLIMYRKKGQEPVEREFFEDVAVKNAHGWGIMWRTSRGELKVKKSLDYKAFWPLYRSLETSDLELAVHYRLRTAGEISKDMCHPFKITDDLYMMHNGTMDYLYKVETSVSDTQAVAEQLIRPAVEFSGPEILLQDWFNFYMEEHLGGSNRLLFLHKDLGFIMVNSDVWSETQFGLTVSNTYAYTYGNPTKKWSGNKYWEKHIKPVEDAEREKRLAESRANYSNRGWYGGTHRNNNDYPKHYGWQDEFEEDMAACAYEGGYGAGCGADNFSGYNAQNNATNLPSTDVHQVNGAKDATKKNGTILDHIKTTIIGKPKEEEAAAAEESVETSRAIETKKAVDTFNSKVLADAEKTDTVTDVTTEKESEVLVDVAADEEYLYDEEAYKEYLDSGDEDPYDTAAFAEYDRLDRVQDILIGTEPFDEESEEDIEDILSYLDKNPDEVRPLIMYMPYLAATLFNTLLIDTAFTRRYSRDWSAYRKSVS